MSRSLTLNILLLFALALLGHLLFFVGFIASDDGIYLAQAQQYLSGDLSPPTEHWGFRYTIVIPLTLLGMFGDFSSQLLALVPLAYWLALIALTAWFMQRLYGAREAWLAGLLVATSPLFVVQSSILGVDITEAFYLFAGFVVFYLAESAPEPDWKRYFLAGALVGLAMLSRETAYGMLLVLGVCWLVFGRSRLLLYLAGLAGVAAVLSIEWSYYLIFDQAPWYRIETITQSHGTVGGISGDFTGGSGNVSDNRWLAPILSLLVNQEFALHFWVGLAALVVVMRKPDHVQPQLLRYLLLACLVYFLWLGYAGAIRPLPRYFAFLLVLCAIPMAVMLAGLSRSWLRYLLVLALVGSNVLALSVENRYPRYAALAISDFIVEQQTDVVASSDIEHRVRAYLRLNGVDTGRVREQAPTGQSYLLAVIEGKDEIPPTLAPHLQPANLVADLPPPKLLIGQILDITGIGGLLPQKLYYKLAIRNPTVKIYRMPPAE